MTRESAAWRGWEPPDTWTRVLAIDAHTAGEPLRVILGGFPDLAGDTILERRNHARGPRPHGTGVSGRLAIHHSRGELAVDEPITIESVIGSVFTGRVVEETTFGGRPAIVPEVEGRAYITGRQELVVDPADPLGGGFLLK